MHKSGDFHTLSASVDALNTTGSPAAARAAIARAWPAVSTTNGAGLRALIESIPHGEWENDPWLIAAIGASYRSIGSGSRSAALLYFRTAESMLAEDPAASVSTVAGVGLHYAAALRSLGRLGAAHEKARAALDALDADVLLRPALRVRLQTKLSLQLGIVLLHLGDYDAAMIHLRLAYGLSERNLLPSEHVECCAGLAFLKYTAGEFSGALGFVEQARAAAGTTPLLVSRFGAAAVITEMLVAIERNQPAVATALVPLVVAAGYRSDWQPLAHHALGAMSVITGRHIEGLDQLRQAIAATGDWEGEPVIRTVSEGMRGVLYLQLGELEQAAAIFAKARPTQNHANCPSRFVAAIRLAEGDPDGCLVALACCAALGDSHSGRTMTDVLLLQAAANYELGSTLTADIALDRALLHASVSGMRTPFLLLPVATLRRMLSRASDRNQPDEVHSLLDDLLGGHGAPRRGTIEPLSERELHIAQHLSLDKTLGQIAADLFISSNTVKTHVRSIYRKLEASNRTEARRRVRELGLHEEITPL